MSHSRSDFLKIYNKSVKRLSAVTGHILGNIQVLERWPLVTITVFYLASRIAGGYLPAFLFRVSLSLWILAYLWTRQMANNLLCIYDSDEKTMQRNRQTELTLRFDNEGLLPIARLHAVTEKPGSSISQQWNVATTVPSLASRLFTVSATMNAHGHYRLGPVQISVGDPFGWFEARKEVYGDRYLTVYPLIMPVKGSSLPLRRPFGASRTRIKSFADPSNLADIRPMQPGDNPKHIHWPTSARRGQPMVKEFELTATGEVNIMIDLYMQTDSKNNSVFSSREARETAFDLCAGLSAACLKSELAVGLIARAERDYSVTPAKGPPALRQILWSLAGAQPGSPVPTDTVLNEVRSSLNSGSTLLFVTGNISPALVSQLTTLVQTGLGVGVFLVVDDHKSKESRSYQDPGDKYIFQYWTVPTDSRAVVLGEQWSQDHRVDRRTF